VTLPDDVQEVLDRLPDERDLLPEEVDPIAAALDADVVSSVTYSDESGATAVSMVWLWWEIDDETRVGIGTCLERRSSGEWGLDRDGIRCTAAEFLDALDQAGDDLGAERRGPHTLVETDEQGNVVDRYERDLSGGES